MAAPDPTLLDAAGLLAGWLVADVYTALRPTAADRRTVGAAFVLWRLVVLAAIVGLVVVAHLVAR